MNYMTKRLEYWYSSVCSGWHLLAHKTNNDFLRLKDELNGRANENQLSEILWQILSDNSSTLYDVTSGQYKFIDNIDLSCS